MYSPLPSEMRAGRVPFRGQTMPLQSFQMQELRLRMRIIANWFALQVPQIPLPCRRASSKRPFSVGISNGWCTYAILCRYCALIVQEFATCQKFGWQWVDTGEVPGGVSGKAESRRGEMTYYSQPACFFLGAYVTSWSICLLLRLPALAILYLKFSLQSNSSKMWGLGTWVDVS